MATNFYTPTLTQSSSSSQRPMAMVLALVSAVVLSPLYVKGRRDFRYPDVSWSSGLVLPAVLAGLIIAIRTASSSASSPHSSMGSSSLLPCSDPSLVFRIGSSSWGLGGVLVMLVMVLSWQHSVQEFLWK